MRACGCADARDMNGICLEKAKRGTGDGEEAAERDLEAGRTARLGARGARGIGAARGRGRAGGSGGGSRELLGGRGRGRREGRACRAHFELLGGGELLNTLISLFPRERKLAGAVTLLWSRLSARMRV